MRSILLMNESEDVGDDLSWEVLKRPQASIQNRKGGRDGLAVVALGVGDALRSLEKSGGLVGSSALEEGVRGSNEVLTASTVSARARG